MGGALIDKDEPSRIERPCDHHPLGGPHKLVAFCGLSTPFLLVEFVRFLARQIVERLSSTPAPPLGTGAFVGG